MPRCPFMMENISGVSPLQLAASGSAPPSFNNIRAACMEPDAQLMCKAVFWEADTVQEGSPPFSRTFLRPCTSFVRAKACICSAKESDIAACGVLK